MIITSRWQSPRLVKLFAGILNQCPELKNDRIPSIIPPKLFSEKLSACGGGGGVLAPDGGGGILPPDGGGMAVPDGGGG